MTHTTDRRTARRLRKPRPPLLQYAAYLAVRFLAMILHSFPVNWNLWAARWAGRVAYRLLRKKAGHARRNLKIAYGHEWSDERIDAVAQASFEHFGMLAVEFMFTPRLITPRTWAQYVTFAPSVGPVVQLLLERKTAVAMLSAHYGNWEVLGYVLATLGFRNTSIARTIENEHINQAVLGVRERTGQRVVGKVGAAAAVKEVLDERGVVCVLGDPSGGRKGVFVNFFGVASSCHKTVGLLCLSDRIPIVVGFARRLRGEFRFRMECVDIIRPEEYDGVDRVTALVQITERYTRGIETMIRGDPSQYLWAYRRFKSRSNAELTSCDDRWRDREDDILAGVCG